MFFALLSVVTSIVCAAVYQTGHHQNARVLASVAAPLLAIVNLTGVALFVLEALHNRRKKRRISTHDYFIKTVLRVLDHYTAINIGWALVVLTIWMWGQRSSPNAYLFILVGAAQHSVFAAWVSALRGSFGIWLTVGSPSIQPLVTFAEALYLLFYWLAWVMPFCFLGVIVSAALERPADEGEEKKVAAALVYEEQL